MKFAGNRIAAWILAAAFVVTASFKIEWLAAGGARVDLARWSITDILMVSIIAFEVGLAVTLLSRARGVAALLTLIFVVGANAYRISAGLASRATYDCGCLGSTHVGPVHHALLSGAFVALSCVIIFDGRTTASH